MTAELSDDLLLIAPSGGHDHASLALMPFIAARDPGQRDTPTSFAYQVHVDGRMRRFQYTLIPGPGGQLPTQYDQPVLLALLQLWLATDGKRRMEFRRQDLFRMLRWSNAGAYHERLLGALQRLTELTIRVETTMTSRTGREYVGGHGSAHLLDRFYLAKTTEESSYVVWGDLVAEARQIGDLKRLDWDLLMALDNPLAAQLYRLLDRVVLSGEVSWAVGWKTLASALGMKSSAYSRPARFRQVMQPHIDALIHNGVVDSVDYQRGGKFVFFVRNYLRAQIRQVLVQMGVFEEAARQLVAGHDEVDIMVQCDCLQHGIHPKPTSPGGWLTDAIRKAYDLRYAEDEPEAFIGLWGMYGATVQRLYHEAGLRVCGVGDSLFDTNNDPTAWSQRMRSVVRFMVAHNLDPEQVLAAGTASVAS